MLKFIFLCILAITLFECQSKLKYELPEKSKLSFYSIVEPGKPISSVVSKSISAFENNRSLNRVDSVLVEVWIDGQPADTLIRTDDFFYTSEKLNFQKGKKYQFKVKDISNNLDEITTEEVVAKEPPTLSNALLKVVSKNINGTAEKILLDIQFLNPNNVTFIGYSIGVDDRDETGAWLLGYEYKCSDEISNLGETRFIELDCLDGFNRLEFSSNNFDTTLIESIAIEVCLTDQLTEELLRVLPLNNPESDRFLSLITAVDNIPSNVTGGYGAILSISCDRIKLTL